MQIGIWNCVWGREGGRLLPKSILNNNRRNIKNPPPSFLKMKLNSGSWDGKEKERKTQNRLTN